MRGRRAIGVPKWRVGVLRHSPGLALSGWSVDDEEGGDGRAHRLVRPGVIDVLYFGDEFRRTISLIQIGAKGEVHPFDTG
jgi:hypothetical protein